MSRLTQDLERLCHRDLVKEIQRLDFIVGRAASATLDLEQARGLIGLLQKDVDAAQAEAADLRVRLKRAEAGIPEELTLPAAIAKIKKENERLREQLAVKV